VYYTAILCHKLVVLVLVRLIVRFIAIKTAALIITAATPQRNSYLVLRGVPTNFYHMTGRSTSEEYFKITNLAIKGLENEKS